MLEAEGTHGPLLHLAPKEEILCLKCSTDSYSASAWTLEMTRITSFLSVTCLCSGGRLLAVCRVCSISLPVAIGLRYFHFRLGSSRA